MQQAYIDRLRGRPVPAKLHWLAGRAVAEQDTALAVISPIDGAEITTIADGSARDVDIAVATARSRFEDGAWSRAAPADRKKNFRLLAGPVLAVMRFKDEGEAIRLANATDDGLAAAVWTSNLSGAHRTIRVVNAGVVHVNTYGGTISRCHWTVSSSQVSVATSRFMRWASTRTSRRRGFSCE